VSTRRHVIASAWLMAGLLLGAGLTSCRRRPAVQPGDPMLDALRAEERAAGFTYAESQGRQLFQQYCSVCHGEDGKGDGENASELNPTPPDLTGSKHLLDADYVRKVIMQGSAAVGRSPLSPPYGRSLRPQEIDYLVAYCQALAKKKPR
jgi:mono/diheme cytochrome c family protein